jgi:hypothetical protein
MQAGSRAAWTALALFAAAALCGARCGKDPLPEVPAVYREVRMAFADRFVHTDAEIVAALAAYPDDFFGFDTENLRPLGHPDTSAADCDAHPQSVGCRIASVHALAEQQGVDAGRMCMSFRFDVWRKWPGWELETIEGVPFDPDWVLRIPGDQHERDAQQFRGGIQYRADIDRAWVESLEDACCHDGVPSNCTADDRCALRYGSGNDVNQTFRVADVALDLRRPELREWWTARLMAQFDDVGADCATVGLKTGRWQYWDQPSGDRCHVPGSQQWFGPVRPWDPCAANGQPLSATPYAPGEYEYAVNETLFRMLTRIHNERRRHLRLITVERPGNMPMWSWIESRVASIAYLAGQYGRTDRPFGTPPPATSALLYPPPQGGLVPVEGVDVSVEAGGSTTGPIDYHVWCNCPYDFEDVLTGQYYCGTGPALYHQILGTTQTKVSIPDACSYHLPGTYYPKVIVVRGGDADEDRIALNAD